ncbi:hypothetical protein [Algibacter sp. L1A34]|uniref:hypothetical protein n=1 Tax=Algibacter sp. L1A34 TaxID=2686365 RepID=UPI00131A8665|nr:hypothetical protein [Algibacter sp. L1A34]
MKFNRLLLLVAITLCFVTKNFAQHGNVRITNNINIGGGITQFDMTTDNFNTKSAQGFLGGMSAIVDIPHRWYNMSFGMQLSENHIEILGRPSLISFDETYIDYKMFAAQLSLLMHIKVIPKYFTIDVGPMLQYNGKLELNDRNQDGYYIANYTNLSAADILNISQFNFNGAVGASVGIKNFKLKAQYIYGFTNILKKLDNASLDTLGGNTRFEGNQNMLVFGAVVEF